MPLGSDGGDACSDRPAAAPVDKPLDDLLVPLHDRLDGAVTPIANPARHTERPRGLRHRVPVAYALHAASNDEALGDHGLVLPRRRA